MSKKQAKKHLKSIHRSLKHLSSLVGHPCTPSPEPSHFLLLANAGHSNGIGRSDVAGILDTCLQPSSYKLYFPPDKQFSVLHVDSIREDLLDFINFSKVRENVLYCTYIREDISFDSVTGARPPGLFIHNDVVSDHTEKELIQFFLDHTKSSYLSQDNLKNRVTLHFGYKFDYKTNLVDLSAPLDNPIPDCVLEVIKLITPLISISPNQLTVNIYEPGQGIPKHVDTHSIFTSQILSVSLGSDVVMDFKNPSSGQVRPVLIPARSLTVMSGESRFLWHHGITPRKTDALHDVIPRSLRVSLTLRECTSKPCTCTYPSQCDSQNYGKPVCNAVESEEDAVRVEGQYVSEVYEEIAEHFSGTRHSPWPGVVTFINSLAPNSLVLDVGCGNGKYLGVRSDVCLIGNDNSANLCGICRDRGHEVFVCNALRIPLRRAVCDSVICIAMLHHMTTAERRLSVLQNIAELLRPGGVGLVTVWAHEQHLDLSTSVKEEKGEGCADSTEDGGVGRRHFASQDVFVDWQLKVNPTGSDDAGSPNKVYYRYYHVFQEGELAALIAQVPSVELVEVTYEKANWCAMFKKL